jgi:hypothetical protein
MKKIIKHFKKNWIRHGFETFAVLIGVLAAFALNDWNEKRVDRKKEQELLVQIRENVLRNMDELNSDINGWDNGTIRSLNRILEAIEKPDIYRDSITNEFQNLHRVSDPTITYAAYDALKDYGLETIQSSTLRTEIVNLFDITYRGLEEQINELEIHLIKPTSGKYVYDHFYRDITNGGTGRLIPNDYNEIIRSSELKNIVSQNLSWTLWFVELKENCLRESQRVLDLLEKEIES